MRHRAFFFQAMTKPLDITGQRFGRLVAVRYVESRNGARWLCRCDCGNETVTSTRSMRYGSTKSCGCGSIEQAAANAKLGREKRAVPYPHARQLKDLYRNMRDRCENPRNKRWDCYGQRGIKVCDAWSRGRREFYRWATEAGFKPGLQIDRIDVNGHYEPSNCRFVTPTVQANNTRRNVYITYAGKTQSLSSWARELGLTYRAIQHRVDSGWSMDRVATQPMRKRSAT